MFRSSATIRISFVLASVTLCALLVALALGLFPDRMGAVAAGRKSLCESLAVQGAITAKRGDRRAMDATLKAAVERNEDLLSAALRRSNGQTYSVIGDHRTLWEGASENSTLTHMHVPIRVDDRLWGTLELVYAKPDQYNVTPIPTAALRQILFVVAISMLGQFVYLKRVLRHLDPSSVIPDRVRKTLDSLAEGLIVLDRDERIVLANEAFAHNVGRRPDELQGRRAEELPWSEQDDEPSHEAHPWKQSIRDGVVETGKVVELESADIARRVFQVNSAPIIGDDGKSRGAFATFSDITALQVRNSQLGDTLRQLEQSRDQISEQNDQLRTLASFDPLTQCLNRRAFFQALEDLAVAAERDRRPISYIILDVDHFKRVNDNHGHQVGDEVLQRVGQILQSKIADRGVVGRYGGEEFSILLPDTELARAVDTAEALRMKIESTPMADLKVTASFGVVELEFDSLELLESLDRADKALYCAKRTGRNRVVGWNEVPDDIDFRETSCSDEANGLPATRTHIPFSAVSVLISALDCRDPATAEHCRRVADICVAMAAGLMSEEDRYVLEVAALLHDIGKLGVPDTILLKPGPLTPEEWMVMDTQIRLGERTVNKAFASSALMEILRNYRAAYGGTSHLPDLPTGDQIPLAARILHVADAFDAMVSTRPYRSAMSEEEAFAELRRCKGLQFDPELVERCIGVMLASRAREKPAIDGVDVELALRIGAQLERLSCAIDGEDRVSLGEIAESLGVVAEDSEVDAIARLADELSCHIEDELPWDEVVRLSVKLLEVCRSTQSAYLRSHEQAQVGQFTAESCAPQ